MSVKKKTKAIILAAVCVLIVAAIALSAVLIYRSTPQFALNEAGKYIDMGDYKSAIIALEEALIKFPDNADIRLALSEAYELSGDIENALRVLEESSENSESNISERLNKLRDNYINISNDDDIAVLSEDRLKNAVNDEPDNPEYRLSLTEKYIKSGNTEAARTTLEQAADDFPDDHRFIIRLAEMIRDTESPQAAEEYLQEIVDGSERASEDTTLALAEMYLLDDKINEAFETVQLIENEDSGSSDELIEKIYISYADNIYAGSIEITEDNSEQVTKRIEKIISDYPNNAEGYLALAKIYDVKKDVNAEYELLVNVPSSVNDDRIAQELGYYNATSEEIKSMLYEYLNNGAELNRKILRNVTRLDIYGSDYIMVSCGDNDNAERPTIKEADGYKFIDTDGIKHDYGNLRTLGFTRYMPELSSLTVCYNKISDLSALEGKNTLTYLNLSYNSTRDISPLSGLASLEELYLGYNIGTENMELSNLSDVTTLKKLSIKGVRGFKSLKSIEALPVLECLNLSDTKFSDTKLLSGFVGLKELYLYNTKVTDVTGLATLTNLEVLNLSNASDGMSKISDISSLSNLKKLKKLYLAYAKINDTSVLANFKELEYLSIYTVLYTPFSFKTIQDMNKLKHLVVRSASFDDFSAISNLTELTHLDLQLTHLREDDLSPLSNLKKLEYLDLSHDGVYNISFLSGLTELKYLYLNNCNAHSGFDYISDITPIAGLVNLEELEISYARIKTFADLSRLTKLKRLVLQDSIKVETDLSFLSGLTSLTHLDLGYAVSLYHGFITDISTLSNLTDLEYLDLEFNSITDPTPLYALKKLKTLEISRNYLEDSAVSSLRDALPECEVKSRYQN